MDIVTTRLRLDALVPEDAAALFAYRGDPAVSRWQGWKPASIVDAARFIETQQAVVPETLGTWWQRAIRLRDSGELIGDVGLYFLAATTVELGITLAPAHQRRGYAREVLEVMLDYAFGGLHKQRVIATCESDNIACAGLLENLGMRQSGEWQMLYIAPEYHCVHERHFELLAPEWLAPPANWDDRG